MECYPTRYRLVSDGLVPDLKCGSSDPEQCSCEGQLAVCSPYFWLLLLGFEFSPHHMVPLSSIYSFPDSLLPAIFPWVTRLIFWNLMLSSLRVTAAKGCLSWSHQGHFLLVASFLPTASISSIHVRFHCGDLFTCPWDVFWGTLNSKTLLLLLTVFRMEGNWQSNRTRKIESYYCSLGSLALLPVFDSAHFQHLSLRVLIDRWPPNAYASQ